MKIFLLALALFSGLANAEIYKCSVDGKVVFSDTECKGGGGKVFVQVAPAGAVTTNSNDKVRIESDVRVKKKLLNDDIERGMNQIYALNSQRESILSGLRSRMGGGDSIKGSLNRTAVASEMTAVNSDYDNKVRTVQYEIDRMKNERDNLGKN